jgi:hypothetical protein
MANFNLADYETVEERIRRFYADNPDARIITRNITSESDRERRTWVVEATVYLNKEDQDSMNPKATGLAFEIDGTGGANKTSALENAETSAIGRALANANYSGNKRATREEMEKVARAQEIASIDWGKLIDELSTKSEARALYTKAQKFKAATEVVKLIEEKASALPE